MKQVLLIDNYDSFTYNLVHAIEEILTQKIEVVNNDKIYLEEVEAYDYIILSPGPGLPDESGKLLDIIARYKSSKKIFGVCLGLQAIGEVYGGKLKNLNKVYHGIQSQVFKTSSPSILYEGVGDDFEAGRYHSWVLDQENIPKELLITAKDENGTIMSIEHKTDSVYGVQYHPESFMTKVGMRILSNFFKLA